MAKKFVRGVTGVDDIEKFDKTLTNVNDLLSDGQNTYVHTKKGNTEVYYNITSAINKVQSGDNTLTITKQNDTVTIANNTLTTKQELAQKQNTITDNASVGIYGTGLRQLYALKQSYTHGNGILKTHVKAISSNNSIYSAEEEFNFIVKINKGSTSASFTLNDHDQTKFTNIMNAYGQANSVRISGLIFTLSGSSLTVSTANSVDHNYVVTFSDII